MKTTVVIAWAAFFATGFPAWGKSEDASQAISREWVAGFGSVNVLDNTDRRVCGSLEYRFDPLKWSLRPWAGLTYAEDRTYLFSAGLVYTHRVRSGFRFSIGWAPGYYHRGDGRALGDELEFYSYGEVGWMFGNSRGLGLRFGHISNGGLKRYNPGTEILELGCSQRF